MSPGRKKVIVRRLAGDFLPGYLAPCSFLHSVRDNGPDQPSSRLLDLLDLDGRSLSLPLSEVKLVCFVRDFNRDDPLNPERLTRSVFLSRPRAEGLWLRITFPGGDLLEGVSPHNLSLLDSLLEDQGIFLTPPDERANTHRIYVPRTAIAALNLIAVINAPSRKLSPRSKKSTIDQSDLFSDAVLQSPP